MQENDPGDHSVVVDEAAVGEDHVVDEVVAAVALVAGGVEERMKRNGSLSQSWVDW